MWALETYEPQGISFIETANLDGETNLKIRQALQVTSNITTSEMLKTLSGTIECEQPSRYLYEFTGTLKKTDELAQPIRPDQILLRGAMLRNTTWVYGLVIYTGHETKLMKNSMKAPLKRSSIDKLTNYQILLLFLILLIMCTVCTIGSTIWTNWHLDYDWYIGLNDISHNIAFNFLTFIILFNNLVPISLQVTLEVVRFMQAIFINMDREMYYAETDTPAMARTSNLNEELGQVKYIFSDKTGTLTRNVMEFKKCSVGDEIYSLTEGEEQPLILTHIKNKHKNAEVLNQMLTLMSVCHTVIPERMPDGELNYHAASPDERALVYGASKFGYKFDVRTPDYVEVIALGERHQYKILNVIEFTSTRKRMSVIVQGPNQKIYLYCKGADTVIYERLSTEGQDNKDALLQQLEVFATEGLRTLCLGYKELNSDVYERWNDEFHAAAINVHNREEKMEEIADLIERDLTLIGATAIEDKLQDEVPETIAALLKADINVWVLTGDKQETAINIGYSSRLIGQGTPLIILNEGSLDHTREAIFRHNADFGENLGKQNEVALIVDGKTLKYSLGCDLRTDFLKLCVSCKVVICCRVSPLQKAEVVEYVTKYTKSVTLAIGDGANDVAMIQKAHVGVGISGVEGLQAACASDYSIAQFRFLLRLLLVHGAWNYTRMCKLILYSFYKNICLYVVSLWFAIYSGWSGQIVFERWSIGLYNVFFTALPPLAIGLFDKNCSANLMLTHPKLYKPSQSGELYTFKLFWLWVFNAIVHSAIIFWFTMLAVQHDILWHSGRDGGYLMFGNCIYTFVVVTVCLKAGLITSSWCWPTHCAIWGSIVIWFLFIIIYSNFWPVLPVGTVMTGMYIIMFTSAVFWLGLFIIPIIALIPDFTIRVILGTIRKSYTETVREREIRHQPIEVSRESKTSEIINNFRLSETARLLKNVRSVFLRRNNTQVDLEMAHGFAFSQEEGGSVSQTEVIRAYDTNAPKPSGN
ncbi:probable phospholipid-transporting ATPase IA [Onthophagus taurus]|uniref:probable phospholipid-transporting ATPase IA n=1 Tax=Onthophagus taurus TaxID=166361 RepID=UPI0039BE9E5B